MQRVYNFLFPVILLYMCFYASAQTNQYRIHTLSLPAELADFDNQFSSLNIYKGRLYFMAESRILEKQQAKIYSVKLVDIKRQLTDATYQLPFKKHLVVGFDKLVDKMLLQKQVCEGFEAMVLKGKQIFLSVETTTESPLCYILHGKFKHDVFYLDTLQMLPVAKPVQPNGDAINNASFESMEIKRKKLLLFFEYNYFEDNNYVFSYKKNLDAVTKDSIPLSRIPFRISDIKRTGKNRYTAINLFYKGGGRDTIYRPLPTDSLNYKLVYNGSGFHDYSRLLSIQYKRGQFTYQPLFEMPAAFEGSNWEGIAVYKSGYFLVNDKYTPTMPYYSTLLYLEPLPLE